MAPRIKIKFPEDSDEEPDSKDPGEAADNVRLFLPSGCHVLDEVLCGGWAYGRVANLVGDKSSGKTLLAIEACANHARLHGAHNIRYAEAEAAFDVDYARTLGLPQDVKPSAHGEIKTVEDFYEDLKRFLKGVDGPALYVLDSLDALSNTAEMESDFGEASYGTGKARDMSKAFRMATSSLADKQCLLLIISQIRDKLNVRFGETKTRSGGRALDFYASQIIWLAEKQKLTHTARGIKRVTGVRVVVKNKKNKLGPPFRDGEFDILFGYGVDDHISSLQWLKGAGFTRVGDLGPMATIETDIDRARKEGNRKLLRRIQTELNAAVSERWADVEARLQPALRKYED